MDIIIIFISSLSYISILSTAVKDPIGIGSLKRGRDENTIIMEIT